MTTTPDMNLILPDPLVTTGPTWATYLNAALTLVDSHDHSSGKGVAITPSGINISGDLTFAQNNATNIRAARFYNNSSITLGINDKSCLYVLNNELHYVDGAGNDIQITLNGALDLNANITSLTLKDSSFYIEYFGDITKKFRFDAASIPTGTTRIISIPESGANDTLVSLAATQTLSNKTIGSGNVLTGSTIASFVSGTGTLTAPAVTDTLATLASSQTLTNKILTGNTVANVKPDGVNTLTFPAVTQTVATLAGSETLTNKVLTGNTVANVKPDGVNTLTFPAVTQTVATLAGSETLTNKVLSGNTAATLISGSGTLTLNTSGTITVPNTTDTLIGKATTDDLTNKSFNGTTVVKAANELRFNNSANTFYTSLKAGSNTGNLALTLPVADGSNGQALVTNGLGVLSFSSAATAAATSTTAGTITREAVWASYTPTVTGLGSVTSLSVFWKILGDSLFVRGYAVTNTPTAALASISLPGSFTIDNSKLPANTSANSGPIVGSHGIQNASDSSGFMVTATTTSTSVVYFAGASNGLNALTPQNGNAIYPASKSFSFSFEVPVT